MLRTIFVCTSMETNNAKHQHYRDKYQALGIDAILPAGDKHGQTYFYLVSLRTNRILRITALGVS